MRHERAARTTAGASGPWSRPAVRHLVLGAALVVAAVVATVSVSYPTGLGVMLVLSALYVAALSTLLVGVLELRTGDHDPGRGGAAALHSWRCAVTDHSFVRVPAQPDAAEHWRCRRCGKRRWSEPRSAGETLNATQVDKLWIKRGDDT